MFACVYTPDFPVEAVVRVEPELREHAVAVVEGEPPLVNVIATNDRARMAGVDSGLTQMQVEERLQIACGPNQWHVRRRSLEQEQAANAALVDCACAFSPCVEVTGIDTVIVDISGLESLFGASSKIARDLARRCSDAGIEVHIAVAANPDAALHAARGYSGITLIPEGGEAERLGPLPLDVLVTPAYGKSQKQKQQKPDLEMLDKFERWGVRTLRGLALLPEVAVVERLGQAGLRWQRFAHGATRRELVLTTPVLQFQEAVELEYAVDLLEPLAFLLSRMLEQLCARLQSRAMATNELHLRLQLDPDITVDREGLPFERKKFDEGEDTERHTEVVESRSASPESCKFVERTIKLPVPMIDAKTFLKLLQLDLKANPPSAPVLKLWLRAEPVRPKFDQRGLFLPLTPEPQKLEITLARLAGVAGQENVGAAQVLDTHRPDSFRITRFAPPLPDYEKKNESETAVRTVSALRRFRPPQPVSVMLVHDRPAEIGPPRELVQAEETTRTTYGEVTWCAGPWRTSGEWWNREPWEREEWDVAISTNCEVRRRKWSSSQPRMNVENVPRDGTPAVSAQVLYRIFRDVLSGTWYVEGEYD
jgi:protein ImuB